MLRFSPDGAKIAVGDAGREIKVWEIGKPEPVITRKWMAHQSTVTTICWAPEGDRLVSGSVDGRIVVWNMSKPREINERPQIHPGGVFCVDWADNNVVYTCGDDACVREVQLVMCSVCATKKLSVFCEYNKSFVKQHNSVLCATKKTHSYSVKGRVLSHAGDLVSAAAARAEEDDQLDQRHSARRDDAVQTVRRHLLLRDAEAPAVLLVLVAAARQAARCDERILVGAHLASTPPATTTCNVVDFTGFFEYSRTSQPLPK